MILLQLLCCDRCFCHTGGIICRPQWTFSWSRSFFHPRVVLVWPQGKAEGGGSLWGGRGVTKRPVYSSHSLRSVFSWPVWGAQEQTPVYSTKSHLAFGAGLIIIICMDCHNFWWDQRFSSWWSLVKIDIWMFDSQSKWTLDEIVVFWWEGMEPHSECNPWVIAVEYFRMCINSSDEMGRWL